MHQQMSMFNFNPFRRLNLTTRPTSKVFTNVTLGMGAFFHISKDCARSVVLGSISVFIRVKFYITNNYEITNNDVRILRLILY